MKHAPLHCVLRRDTLEWIATAISHETIDDLRSTLVKQDNVPYASVPFERTWKPPAWVSEGSNVWLPWSRENGSALRCTVATACGLHARVVNANWNVDKLVKIDELVVPPGDPHRYEVLPLIVAGVSLNQDPPQLLDPPHEEDDEQDE